MQDDNGNCWQCHQPECKGKDLIYCPNTKIYHDACDEALAQLYAEDRMTSEPEGLEELPY